MDLPDFVPAVPVDLDRWRVLQAVVREAEGRVAVEVAVEEVVEAAATGAAAVSNGSIASQRA